jgi:hypothetical protein
MAGCLNNNPLTMNGASLNPMSSMMSPTATAVMTNSNPLMNSHANSVMMGQSNGMVGQQNGFLSQQNGTMNGMFTSSPSSYLNSATMNGSCIMKSMGTNQPTAAMNVNLMSPPSNTISSNFRGSSRQPQPQQQRDPFADLKF